MINVNGIAQAARIIVRFLRERFATDCKVPFGQSSHSSELAAFGFIYLFFSDGKLVYENPGLFKTHLP